MRDSKKGRLDVERNDRWIVVGIAALALAVGGAGIAFAGTSPSSPSPPRHPAAQRRGPRCRQQRRTQRRRRRTSRPTRRLGFWPPRSLWRARRHSPPAEAPQRAGGLGTARTIGRGSVGLGASDADSGGLARPQSCPPAGHPRLPADLAADTDRIRAPSRQRCAGTATDRRLPQHHARRAATRPSPTGPASGQPTTARRATANLVPLASARWPAVHETDTAPASRTPTRRRPTAATPRSRASCRAPTATTVIVGATTPGEWNRLSPTPQRAISSFDATA